MAKNDRNGSWFKEAMSLPETGPALRRYFVNTMFDSTFAVLGIIIGSALTADADKGLVIATIITSCVALAISTGSSVYEGGDAGTVSAYGRDRPGHAAPGGRDELG